MWLADEEILLFSDVVQDVRRRWHARDGIVELARPTGHGNGMTLDAAGRLIVCEHDTSAVVRMDRTGTGAGREVLASHWDGRELNSPNDVCVHSSGAIYFTDPPYGRLWSTIGLKRDLELDFSGVYRIAPDGALTLLSGELLGPNGLCFSPDESLLYVNDTRRGDVFVFDVADDGSVGAARLFAQGVSTPNSQEGAVDGMKCDERGNVWVTGPGGIWAFGPAGKHLGVLPLPSVVGNFHWGGPEWSWLLVCAGSDIYRVPMHVRGRHEPFMT